MVIRFTCPNGHSLSSPQNRAGRKGKCPECGVAVQVPEHSEENGAAKGDVIVFLCPNGHRLHGPRSLEGRAGQCPHCGVKFRVPSREDLEEHVEEPEDSQGSKILVGEVPAFGELSVQGVPPAEEAPAEEPLFNFNFEEPRTERGSDLIELNLDTSGGSSPDSGLPLAAEPGSGPLASVAVASGDSGSAVARPHPLAELFVKLWDEKAKGAFVEIHLAEGVVVVPERFARRHSRQTHAVFAVKDPDGTHTLTVVPWDSVARISVRRVGKLPKSMFD